MKWVPAPIIGGAYSDNTKSWSVQDTLNYVPVIAERSGTRTPSMLRGVPGLVSFCDLATNAPIRGMHNVEGLLLVVSGRHLFKVSALGTPVLIGTIPGVERVSMEHNQVAGGNQVAIANGQEGYVYNTVDGSLVQITDPGFVGSISFAFDDGYMLGIDPSLSFGFTSQLADATSYNTLDRYQAEGSPDKLVGQIVTHREWWLFGQRTIEPYVDDGSNTGTFERNSGIVMDVGAASRWAICTMNNCVFWLGNDGVVYKARAYFPEQISTHAIEQAIALTNTSQAFAFTFEDQGHIIFYLTFPDGMTFGYDDSTNEWHRRKSYGMDRWRINDLVLWNGSWIAGDYTNGKLYKLDWLVQNEDGAVLERRRTTGVLSADQNPVTVNGVALIIDTGMPQPAPPSPPRLVITGDLPDGRLGDVVSFWYYVSGGVPPYGPLTIVSGALPTGLTLGTDGHVTGTLTAGGSFSWVVSDTDSLPQTATLADTCRVTEIVWWLTTGGNPSMPYPTNVWISTDPRVWPNAPVVRSPFVTTQTNFGVKWMKGDFALIVGGTSAVERTTTLDGSGGITTASVTIAAAITTLFGNGSVSVACCNNSSNWYTSIDDGLTWQTHTVSGGLYIHSVGQMTSGRWIGMIENGGTSYFVYSDQTVPTVWTAGTTALSNPLYYPIAIGSNYALSSRNSGAFWKTTDGASWVASGGGTSSFLADVRYADANGNTALFSGAPKSLILPGMIRTGDAGVTWTNPSGLPANQGIERIEYDNGYWIAQCDNKLLYVSVDDGLTFTQSATPSVASAVWMAASVEYMP